jgi:hypothetical protein
MLKGALRIRVKFTAAQKTFLTTRKKFGKAKQMGFIMAEDNLTGQ